MASCRSKYVSFPRRRRAFYRDIVPVGARREDEDREPVG